MELSTELGDLFEVFGDKKARILMHYIEKRITEREETKKEKKVIFTNPQLDELTKQAFSMGYTEYEIYDIFAKALASSMDAKKYQFKYLTSETGEIIGVAREHKT